MESQTSLPQSHWLPVSHLAASFNNVTNSYKFYWFMSILEHVRENRSRTIPIDQLVARMIAGAWYPANYFRLSFGKQDRLGQIALAVRRELQLPPATSRRDVADAVLDVIESGGKLARLINSLGIYVPFRFLRPFFAEQLRGETDWKVNGLIRDYAGESFETNINSCLYRFDTREESIEIHPLWWGYIQEHLSVLSGFCFWHLLVYLQKNNPNVPNIAGKLFEPQQRDLRSCRVFWNHAISSLESIRCIYSQELIDPASFSLDHFLPWSFVTHDLLWNIVPTLVRVNASKSDQLPDFGRYFESFSRLQYEAFRAVSHLRKERLLEDYIVLFKRESSREIAAMEYEEFSLTLHDTLAPQVQIARNMGFAANWRYRATLI